MRLAIDFDNVLYDYDGQWRGGELMLPPVAGAAESMRRLTGDGHKLIIYSTRGWLKAHRERMAGWLEKNGIPFDKIASTKPNADIYIDDKAYRFTSWPETMAMLNPPAPPASPPRVLLYRVGRNLNRTYRTCASFGIAELALLECDARLSGLFSAAGKVSVTAVDDWPKPETCLALETHYTTPLAVVDWGRVETIVLGGETGGLPRTVRFGQMARIPTAAGPSLTVEAALAVALYEWSKLCNH